MLNVEANQNENELARPNIHQNRIKYKFPTPAAAPARYFATSGPSRSAKTSRSAQRCFQAVPRACGPSPLQTPSGPSPSPSGASNRRKQRKDPFFFDRGADFDSWRPVRDGRARPRRRHHHRQRRHDQPAGDGAVLFFKHKNKTKSNLYTS